MKTFGIRLKKLRESRGITLKELANCVKIDEFALIMWEKSKKVLNLDRLIKLAQYFNVTIDYLVGL